MSAIAARQARCNSVRLSPSVAERTSAPHQMFVAHQMFVVSHEYYFLQRMFGLLVAGATLTACFIWSYRQSLSRRAGQT